MISLEAKVVNLDVLRRAMGEMPAALFPAVKEGLEYMLAGFRKEFLATTPAHLSRRRRGLASNSSWPIESTGNTLDSLVVSLFTESPAAHLMEVGGTVKPKSGQYLALPLAGALNKAGTARLPGYRTPAEARARRGAVFVTYTTKKGTKLLLEVRRGGKRQRGTIAAYVLVPSLHAKPVLGFFSAWTAHGPDNAVRRVGKSIDKVLKAFAPKAV